MVDQKRKKTMFIVVGTLVALLVIVVILSRKETTSEQTNSNNVSVVEKENVKKEDTTQTIIDLLTKDVEGKKQSENNVFVNKELAFQMEYPSSWSEMPNAATIMGVPQYGNVKVVGVLKGQNEFDYISIVMEVPKNKIDSKTYMGKTKEIILSKYPSAQIIKENEDLAGGNKSYGRLLSFIHNKETIYQYQLYIEGSQGIYIVTYSGIKDNFTVQFSDLKRTVNSIKVEQK